MTISHRRPILSKRRVAADKQVPKEPPQEFPPPVPERNPAPVPEISPAGSPDEQIAPKEYPQPSAPPELPQENSATKN